MTEKQLSFAERIHRLDDVARQLDTLAAIIAEEVGHMQTAAVRFAERNERPKDKARP